MSKRRRNFSKRRLALYKDEIRFQHINILLHLLARSRLAAAFSGSRFTTDADHFSAFQLPGDTHDAPSVVFQGLPHMVLRKPGVDGCRGLK